MTQQTSAELDRLPVPESWKQWEGQDVNGEFPLQRFLGGSAHSAVFLTEYGREERQNAAIKLVPDHPGTGEMQLSQWALARGLSHPNLLSVFQVGRCRLGDARLLYMVMEYAEENLAQIVPQRALAPVEVRDMLGPVLDALAHLHGVGLVHGQVKPSNIMARGDQIKVSTDGLCRIGEALAGTGAYDPPERKYSAATDSWALGMTLVEVLTQHLPIWERSHLDEEPAVPQTLAEPFLGITRRCLRRNPALRLKVADIASRLDLVLTQAVVQPAIPPAPMHSPAARSSAQSPAHSSSADAGSIHSASLSPSSSPSLSPSSSPSLSPSSSPSLSPSSSPTLPAGSSASSRSFGWIAATGGLLVILVAGLLVLRHRPHSVSVPLQGVERTGPQAASNVSNDIAAPAPPPAAKESAPAGTRPSVAQPGSAQPSHPQPGHPPSGMAPATPPLAGNTAASGKVSTSAAAPPVQVLPKEEKPKEQQGSSTQEGIQQVLPDVPQKARNTIHGTLRLSVKVSVDPSGHVSSAALEAPGPSAYFANFALRAAKQWVFPGMKGGSGSRDWILHFAFTSTDTRAVATPATP